MKSEQFMKSLNVYKYEKLFDYLQLLILLIHILIRKKTLGTINENTVISFIDSIDHAKLNFISDALYEVTENKETSPIVVNIADIVILKKCAIFLLEMEMIYKDGFIKQLAIDSLYTKYELKKYTSIEATDIFIKQTISFIETVDTLMKD